MKFFHFVYKNDLSFFSCNQAFIITLWRQSLHLKLSSPNMALLPIEKIPNKLLPIKVTIEVIIKNIPTFL